MKILTTSLLALAAVVFIGACDSHSFKETQVLHEKYRSHGDHHGDTHGAGDGHKAEAGHGAADAHAPAAAGHGEKKAH